MVVLLKRFIFAQAGVGILDDILRSVDRLVAYIFHLCFSQLDIQHIHQAAHFTRPLQDFPHSSHSDLFFVTAVERFDLGDIHFASLPGNGQRSLSATSQISSE